MSTLHRIEPARKNLHGHFSAHAAPAVTIDSGDVVAFATPDVSWGLEPPTSLTAPRRKVEDRGPGPCLCGPIAVRGAAPGDAIEVVIEFLRPSSWGWTYAGKGMVNDAYNAALGYGDAPLALLMWTLNDDRTVARSHLGDRAECAPFLGTIGLAPPEEHADGWTPTIYGGNMDCRELTQGSRLFLPVGAPGGLLSAGDGHAAQGDGELSGTAIECAMDEIRLRLILHKGLALKGPRIRTADAWITPGFGPTLDEAAKHAASAMLDLLAELTDRPRADAAALASSRVHLRVTQMVNPHVGVHALLPMGGAERI